MYALQSDYLEKCGAKLLVCSAGVQRSKGSTPGGSLTPCTARDRLHVVSWRADTRTLWSGCGVERPFGQIPGKLALMFRREGRRKNGAALTYWFPAQAVDRITGLQCRGI